MGIHKKIPSRAVAKRLATPNDQRGRADILAYIKRRMQEENLTQIELAAYLGKSQQNVANGVNRANKGSNFGRDTIENILWLLDGDDALH